MKKKMMRWRENEDSEVEDKGQEKMENRKGGNPSVYIRGTTFASCVWRLPAAPETERRGEGKGGEKDKLKVD